jgi:hypothetical protein
MQREGRGFCGEMGNLGVTIVCERAEGKAYGSDSAVSRFWRGK